LRSLKIRRREGQTALDRTKGDWAPVRVVIVDYKTI